MIAAGLSAEFRLVAACCRPRTYHDFVQVIAAEAGKGFDPDLLLATAHAHRVEGFVEDGLRAACIELPLSSQILLAARAMEARHQILRNGAEEIRVTRLFRANGIEPVFVKGATLAVLAYGSLALKTSWDSDLLIAPNRIGAARGILSAAGYRLCIPGINAPNLIDRYILRNKETTWINDDRSTVIELHSALVDATALLPRMGPDSPTQSVHVTRNNRLTTFARPELFTYLCVHGSTHRWERLKWLTDVAALIATGPETVEDLHATASRLGAANSADAALLLCSRLFGLELPQRLYQQIERTRSSLQLALLSIAALKSLDTVDTTSIAGVAQELARLRAQRLQVSGLRAWLSLVHAQMSLAYTPDRLILPQWLLPYHALLWLPLRLTSRPWRKRQSAAENTASKP